MSIKFLLILFTLIPTPVFAQQAAAFKNQTGSIFIYGLQPSTIVEAKITTVAGTSQNKRVRANICGYAIFKNIIGLASAIELPTIQGGKANFTITNIPQSQELVCIKGILYFPVGFNPKTVIASVTPTSTPAPTSTTTTTTNSQNAQPVAVKNGNFLIISGIPPGTYIVSNASNPTQKQTYTVNNKACLVSDRTTIGNPTQFIISRQGLTFPLAWNNLHSVPSVPNCI